MQNKQTHEAMLHLCLYLWDSREPRPIWHSCYSSLSHYTKAGGYSWPPKVCCPGNVELDAPCFPTDPHCSNYEENYTLSRTAKLCCSLQSIELEFEADQGAL